MTRYSGYRSPRPWLRGYPRPIIDPPSALIGFGIGVLLASALAVLVMWRVGQ